MWKKFKWDMLITSFLPLWLTIILSDVWEIMDYMLLHPWNPGAEGWKTAVRENGLLLGSIVALLITVIISMVSILLHLGRIKKNPSPHGGIIEKGRLEQKRASEFLLAYILPMLAFDFSRARDLLFFLIYFSALAYLSIRNNNVYTNIFLELLGYRMYICDVRHEMMNHEKIYEDSLVISRRNLSFCKEMELKYWDFESHIYIDVEKGMKK